MMILSWDHQAMPSHAMLLYKFASVIAPQVLHRLNVTVTKLFFHPSMSVQDLGRRLVLVYCTLHLPFVHFIHHAKINVWKLYKYLFRVTFVRHAFEFNSIWRHKPRRRRGPADWCLWRWRLAPTDRCCFGKTSLDAGIFMVDPELRFIICCLCTRFNAEQFGANMAIEFIDILHMVPSW